MVFLDLIFVVVLFIEFLKGMLEGAVQTFIDILLVVRWDR